MAVQDTPSSEQLE
jgi:hypothetical protein